MNPIAYRFLEPLDILTLRGNKLFGSAGSYGESQLPPWPSVAAGALRSRILSDDGVDLQQFARGSQPHESIGTPEQPGSFRLTDFLMAVRRKDGSVEAVYAKPADMVIYEDNGAKKISLLQPRMMASGIQSSSPCTHLPILECAERIKVEGGYWLTQSGWQRYLMGEIPLNDQILHQSQLWSLETRVGVGLDASRGAAADGHLFSSQVIAFMRSYVHQEKSLDVGFLVGAAGCKLPRDGLLRLGGDGRGTAITEVSWKPSHPDYEAISAAGRCRLILTTPCLLPKGWNWSTDMMFDVGGVKGTIQAFATGRYDVISGWDMAKGCPKTAERFTPAGSVYWLDQLQGSAADLQKLVEEGLWDERWHNPHRCAEGFNRCQLAPWTTR